VDDDPTCDHGATSGDEACTFRVALCLNVSERRLVDRRTAQPLCAATDVAWAVLKAPREADPRDGIDAANRDALEAALTALGAAVRRQCEPPGVSPSTSCVSDVDCGPRRCRSRFVEFIPPFGERDRCTAFVDVAVPLRPGRHALKAGKRTLRLTVARATPHTARDTDVLRLVCIP
jgi:hypothetical protein